MRQGRFDVSVSRHKRMKRQPPITGKRDDTKKDCEKNFALYIVVGMVPVASEATGTDLESVRCEVPDEVRF